MDHYATKRKAWRHTQSLFAVRVCGMTPRNLETKWAEWSAV